MVFLVTFHGYSLPSHSVLSASLLLPLSLPLRSPPVLLSSCCNSCRGRRACSPATPCLPSARHLYLPHIVYGIFPLLCRILPTATHTPYWLHDIPLFFTASSGSRMPSAPPTGYSPSSPFPLSVTTRFLYSHGLFFSPALPSADNGTPPALSTGTSFPCSTDLALSNT